MCYSVEAVRHHQSLTSWYADYPALTPLFITSSVYTSKFMPKPRPNSIDIDPCTLSRPQATYNHWFSARYIHPSNLYGPRVIIWFNQFNISDLMLHRAVVTESECRNGMNCNDPRQLTDIRHCGP